MKLPTEITAGVLDRSSTEIDVQRGTHIYIPT